MFDSQRKGETIKPFTESQSWELLIRLLGPEWQDLQRRCLLEPCEVEAAKELLRNLSGVSHSRELNNFNLGRSLIETAPTSYKTGCAAHQKSKYWRLNYYLDLRRVQDAQESSYFKRKSIRYCALYGFIMEHVFQLLVQKCP